MRSTLFLVAIGAFAVVVSFLVAVRVVELFKANVLFGASFTMLVIVTVVLLRPSGGRWWWRL